MLSRARLGNLLLFFSLQGAAVVLEGLLTAKTKEKKGQPKKTESGAAVKSEAAVVPSLAWAPRARGAAGYALTCAFLFLTHACLVFPPGWEKSVAMTRRYMGVA